MRARARQPSEGARSGRVGVWECVRGSGERKSRADREAQKGGECARAPGLAAGAAAAAAAAAEKGGGSWHPDALPSSSDFQPPGGPRSPQRPWPSSAGCEAKEKPPEPERVYIKEKIIQEKEEQADRDV